MQRRKGTVFLSEGDISNQRAMCAPLKRPLQTKQSSQIAFVISAHTHTFIPKRIEELKEKPFPFNFSHGQMDRRVLIDTAGLSRHSHRKCGQGNPINKHFSTFCDVRSHKHKTCFHPAVTHLYSGARNFNQNSPNSHLLSPY